MNIAMKRMIFNMAMLSLLIVSNVINSFAISPELTAPRIGDVFSVGKLKNSPDFSDSLLLCPNLTYAEVEKYHEYKVWPSAAYDTISNMTITFSSNVKELFQKGDTLHLLSTLSPGKVRTFVTYPRYGYISESRDIQILSHGETSDIGRFSTIGNYTTTLKKNLSIITLMGDTIENVECCNTNIEELLLQECQDTLIYKSIYRQWYAPGYRYPLLTHEYGKLLSLDNDTLDYVSNWYAMNIPQFENVVDDPINEAIRTQQREIRNNIQNKHYSKGSNSQNTITNESIFYDLDRDIISVSRNFTDGRFESYILCDIAGVVFKRGDIGSDGTTISTKFLNPGNYILYVATSDSPIIYKFNIPGK